MKSGPPDYEKLKRFSLAEVEAIRILLRGGSVIDWHRLNFIQEEEISKFLYAHAIDLSNPADSARTNAVKHDAIEFLRRNFEFPIPKPIENASLPQLLRLASTKGHRQLCACTVLKVMHIIHHLEARELLFMLPTSDEEVFHLVERKVYGVIGQALKANYPIVEFIGGRKHKDSLLVKLLSKPEVSAAQIYDKLRFRIVTREKEDIFPILKYMQREIFPFNYVIPGESHNTLMHFRSYCEEQEELRQFLPMLQLSTNLEDAKDGPPDNRFSSQNYRVAHFCVDMPVRIPETMLADAPPAAWALGRVIFVQTEFQIIYEEADRMNERGDASHASYKGRQKGAVMQRLKVGLAGTREAPGPGMRTTLMDLELDHD